MGSRAKRAGPERDADAPDHIGDVAIVLHSHMPYVEGFGTYPFGEEWLFDAVARSHLPILDVAERVSITVTPVLADQLEAEGVADRMLAFLRRHRLGAAERDGADAYGALAAAAAAEEGNYRFAIERLEELDGDVLAAFKAVADRGCELVASAATHAVMPKIATVEARRLQIDVGLRSHRRRFGPGAGFWLPECAYAPRLDGLLRERGVAYTCVDQSAVEAPLASLAPARTETGLVAFTIDWPAVALVWSEDGYPSNRDYLEYHRLSANGIRLWGIGGDPYDPDEARRRAAEHADAFLTEVGARLAEFARRRRRPGLVVFAIDTELLGHHWAEGPAWLAAVLAGAEDRGIRPLTLGEALAEHAPEERPLVESSWGEGKDLSTWDSPAVADLAWGARRLELRMLRELAANGLSRPAAERAARELLAVQSSDWAFLDSGGKVGDYAYQRAVAHARGLLEAIDSGQESDPRVRNLAPDLSLAPLLEP